MKNYYTEENKIIVTNLSEFNITHILECGQIFRYKNFGDHYEVFSLNKKASVYTFDDKIEILTKDVDYFVNFFDLNTSYAFIKAKLGQFEVLDESLRFAYGIRILNQNPFEMIVSFIISANNNIKRIQSIIEKICEKFGSKNFDENFYAFPSREELLKATKEDFKQLGAGYRAEYLYNVVRQLENFDYDFIKNNSSEKCLPNLLSLSGVGPKVADCILLFGFHKSDVFPVDTWIKKIYNEYFKEFFDEKIYQNFNFDEELESLKNKNINKNNKKNDKENAKQLNDKNKQKKENVKQIRTNLIELFKDLSGYAQQYLFYYKRSTERK